MSTPADWYTTFIVIAPEVAHVEAFVPPDDIEDRRYREDAGSSVSTDPERRESKNRDQDT